MEVVVGTNGGRIEGNLRGSPAPPSALIIAPDFFRRDNPALYRTLNLYGGDRFVVCGLAPGTYKVFAVPYPNEGVPYRNAEFLARYESRSLTITIEKGSVLAGVEVPYLRD